MLRHTPSLNRGHPLARGLVYLLVAGYPVELVSGRRATIGTATQTVVSGRTRWGRAFESTVTTGAQYVSVSDSRVADRITTRSTFFVALDTDALNNQCRILTIPWGTTWAAAFVSMAFATDESGGAEPKPEYAVAGSYTNWDPNGTFWATGTGTYAWVRDGATSILYKNAAEFISTSALNSGAVDFSGAGAEVIIQGTLSSAATPDSLDGRQPFSAIWNRPLSVGELAALYADPEALFRPTGSPVDLIGLLGGGAAGPAASGVVSARVAVSATAVGVQSQSGAGAVRAAVAVAATAVETRQATGRANSPASVVAKTTGAQLTAVGGVVRAAVAVTATAVEKRQTSGAANSPAAVTVRAAGSRQATGRANSPAAVVVKTTGTQGAVIGGAVRAAVAVFARTAGSRQATGTANSPATVTARTAAGRATSGAARAGVVVVARITGGQVAVVGGIVNAAMSGTARAAGKHGGTGIVSAAATGTVRCTGKHGGTGTVRAAGVAYCLVAARRATSGASRAVGVVYAQPRATVSALGGDAQQALSSPGATSSLSRQGATVTFQRVNRATQELQPL